MVGEIECPDAQVRTHGAMLCAISKCLTGATALAILAEGAIALSVTLSGGALFAS